MKRLIQSQRADKRRGAIVVLAAFFITGLLALVAMAVDLGYLMNVKSELQRAADSAAMAAAWELVDEDALAGAADLTDDVVASRNRAEQFAGLNAVSSSSPNVDTNSSNTPTGDVVVGYINDPANGATMTFANPNDFNSVKVRVRRTAEMNGEAPLFFARALGLSSQAMSADATAALNKSFMGFQALSSNENLDILPFALDEETWNDMLAGGGTDDYCWDAADKDIDCGSDGIREVNLYPQGTGSPGNRGTVDIGPSGNSTSHIASQILNGVTQADLSHIGGQLKLSASGTLMLNGDTGISAGVKAELAAIKGKPRIIPIFRTVDAPGNNAQYTIVEFAGVRIMDVKLTGSMSGKKVIIQPCQLVIRSGIPNPDAQTSHFIYSPVRLVRQ